MATRRPKVPRAAAAAPKSSATSRGEADGGHVIRADFGGPRHGSEPAGRPSGHDAGPAAPEAPGTGKPGPAGGAAAPARTGAAKTGARENAPATPAAGRGAGTKSGQPGQTEGLDPVPAKAFSGRLLALGVVMIAITIMLAPTVRIFLEKRAEIADLEAEISAQQAKQTDLKREVSRWQDPNYVKQQARDRINMVMPGETGYWVYGSDLPAATSGSGAAAGTATDPANLPWVDSLWDSIRRSATD
ncbi:septum formation initiator family protein [Arthrobacter sp. C9C5]|uniref:FtsB family cell division protein n=1 Tax=Arthrobacter sp. C9C5 TaxID=2735267 RepID=UPI0015847917|nr:septum formation initiator family protein [Arthrobacter sp. C9C5]NUU32856.1 septum formation initiator family protein [Arthrobacter sp. C9C5]